METATPSIRPARTTPRWHLFGIAALWLLSLVAAGYALRSALRIEDVNTPPAAVPLSDPAELTTRRHDVVGTFATGDTPNDHAIVVHPDGRIWFQLAASPTGAFTTVDRYTLARQDKHIWLVTPHSGYVEAVDIDQLTYCGDTYRRTRSSP
jgi:hypothetical protein